MNIAVEQLGFEYKYIPSSNVNQPLTLLLLHGTGGDESDLIPLGRSLDPDANILSPRGKVLENGMPRFFKRLAPGVFDIEDLKRRTFELSKFAENGAKVHGYNLDKIVAVGFSNGANIAASLLMFVPRLLAGAILFRPMLPVQPETKPDLSKISVFISAGMHDPAVPKYQPKKLSDILGSAGANVTLHYEDAGHDIAGDEIVKVREWLSKFKNQIQSQAAS